VRLNADSCFDGLLAKNSKLFLTEFLMYGPEAKLFVIAYSEQKNK